MGVVGLGVHRLVGVRWLVVCRLGRLVEGSVGKFECGGSCSSTNYSCCM